MINKKGLAQIPLMIGLLIMAIVVPIATRLVQQNQENRGQAACYANYAGCSNNASCCSGYCSGICMPASNPTTKPVATSIPVPSCRTEGQSCANITCCNSQGLFCNSARICVKPATPTPNPCSVSSGKPSNCPCSYNNQCSSGYCSGVCTTPPPPTATPTNDPRQPCGSWRTDDCSTGSCTGGQVCINNHSIGSKCVCIAPTATPMPTCGKDGSYCDSNQPCCSGNTCTLNECYAMPTCGKVGSYCDSNQPCCSGNTCTLNECYVMPTNTPIPGGPIVPIVTNPPGDDSMCPGAEACPHSETDLLRNCTPADADGTSKDTRCNADAVGTIGQCGGKEYCCPTAGGAWTLDMTNCPTTCKVKTDPYTLNDFSIWRIENIEGSFGTVSRNTWNADFDCDGKVTLNDYSVWRSNYFNGLSNN